METKIILAFKCRLLSNYLKDDITIKHPEYESTIVRDKASLIATLVDDASNVLLVDEFFDPTNIVELLKEIRKKYLKLIIILLISENNTIKNLRVVNKYVNGFLAKTPQISNELKNALETIREGKKYICLQSQGIILELIRNKKYSLDPKKINTRITPREYKIVKMISQGLTDKEIANNLGLSSRTIQSHRRNMMRKFEAKNSLHLIKILYELDILP